jgi:type IV secretory pathway VirB4 component
VTDEKAQMQQKYTIVIHEKTAIEEKVERILKDKSKVKEKAYRILKEKDEVEQQEERIQQAIQKLYKDILEMPSVVEATMEEQVSNIREVIKGFCTRIEELKSRSTSGTPPKERAGRERTTMTAIENLKRLDEECTNICEESAQIWTTLMDDPYMKVYKLDCGMCMKRRKRIWRA